MRSLVIVATFVVLVAEAGCGDAPPPQPVDGTITVTSTEYENGGKIPKVHDCDNAGKSVPLAWTGVPDGAVEVALSFEHVNVPFVGRVTHWLVFGMAPDRTGLDEGIPLGNEIDGGGLQGTNQDGTIGWIPPCPPAGLGDGHYFASVYALDKASGLKAGAVRDDFVAALEGHVIASGQLFGTLGR